MKKPRARSWPSWHPVDPVRGTIVFSPVLKATGERLDLLADYGSFPQSNAPGYHGIVRDVKSGKRYAVYGKPCDLACHCDAWVIAIGEDADEEELRNLRLE